MEKNKARLTFSNPNYSGSGHYNDEPGKSTFFKRFKYDKSQVNPIFFLILKIIENIFLLGSSL